MNECELCGAQTDCPVLCPDCSQAELEQQAADDVADELEWDARNEEFS